jgi:hypothetical protein
MAAHEVFDLPLFLTFADYPRFLRYLVESRGITTVVVHNDLFAYRLLPFLRAWCPQVTVLDFLHIVQDHYHGGVPRAALTVQTSELAGSVFRTVMWRIPTLTSSVRRFSFFLCSGQLCGEYQR